jgi:ribosome-binding protein aMBF1 (putative translation factor)
MSAFDRYTKTEEVEALRIFLGLKKQGFLLKHGFIDSSRRLRIGRLASYKQEAIDALVRLANKKSGRAEETDTDLGERIRLAQSYMGLSDTTLAGKLQVSRELVRRWGVNLNRPTNLLEIAKVLDVPPSWLVLGGEERLPANSHVGVRFGEESMLLREQLYALTLDLLVDIPTNADVEHIRAHIEHAVFNRPEISKIARQAGGRWQLLDLALVFAPWVPIAEHGLARRFWSDAVELIVQQELESKSSVYGAWISICERCKALGLESNEYPKKISLYKREEIRRARVAKFGVDLNRQVDQAVARYRSFES